jgi:hypothetical protein
MNNFVPIPNWEVYGINQLGQIARIGGKRKGAQIGKLLKIQTHNTRGYSIVRLYDQQRQKSFDVHKLMAITFLGDVPAGHQICHNNGIKTDCRLENLRIDTTSSNQMDRIKHGTSNRGIKNNQNKYQEETILIIKSLLNSGAKSSQISKFMFIPYQTIRNIKINRAWAWL